MDIAQHCAITQQCAIYVIAQRCAKPHVNGVGAGVQNGRVTSGRADTNRRRILDVALAELLRDPDASMDQIARAAGVVRRTVYGHFPSREALVAALVDDAVVAVEAAQTEGRAGVTDPAEAVARSLLAVWEVADRYRLLVALAQRAVTVEGIRARLSPVRDSCTELLQQGLESGEFVSPLPPPALAYVHEQVAVRTARSGQRRADPSRRGGPLRRGHRTDRGGRTRLTRHRTGGRDQLRAATRPVRGTGNCAAGPHRPAASTAPPPGARGTAQPGPGRPAHATAACPAERSGLRQLLVVAAPLVRNVGRRGVAPVVHERALVEGQVTGEHAPDAVLVDLTRPRTDEERWRRRCPRSWSGRGPRS